MSAESIFVARKVAIVLGRGIEGCGITRYTRELLSWLKTRSIDAQVFYVSDHVHARESSQDLRRDSTPIDLESDESVSSVVDALNDQDVVILNSLPARTDGRSKGLNERATSGWSALLTRITAPVVMIVHEHSSHTIRKNALLDEAIDKCRVIFVHSETNDMGKLLRSRLYAPPLETFQPALSFRALRAEYWKRVEETDGTHHKWIGRTTPWKGPETFLRASRALSALRWTVTMEGLDTSPAFIPIRKNFTFNAALNRDPSTHVIEQNGLPTLFGPYKNTEMLERMSKVGFGYALTKLKPQYVHRSLEYAQAEIPAVGAIPVYTAEHGRNCLHRVTGDPLICSPNSYTIWLDEEFTEEQIDTLKTLSRDSVARDEWREGAFKFYESHQDVEPVFEELLSKIRRYVQNTSRHDHRRK